MVALRDPVLALDFDLAAAARLLEIERAALTDSNGAAGDSSPGATRSNIYW